MQDPSNPDLMNQIAFASYKVYASIAKNQQSNFIDGAFIMPSYFPNRKESGLEPYVAASV
jgi:hypothetical protein